MSDRHEANSVDSFDDDRSQSVAEEIGLLSQKNSMIHRASWLDRLLQNAKTRVQQLLDPDILKNITVIALLVVLWHSFSLSISLVSDDWYSFEAASTDDRSTTNGCSPGIALSFPFPSS
jgi:hypothetical protein